MDCTRLCARCSLASLRSFATPGNGSRVDKPFAGVRIVEIGGSVAAAGATKTLGDYGALVTKVETRAGGEVRRLGPFPGDVPHLDRSAFHLALDTSKRSLILDIESPSGLEVLIALATASDVAVVHLPAEAAHRVLGALDGVGDSGPTTVALSTHGLVGPFAGREENDLTLFAWSNGCCVTPSRIRSHCVTRRRWPRCNGLRPLPG
jgi:hypothetical protein